MQPKYDEQRLVISISVCADLMAGSVNAKQIVFRSFKTSSSVNATIEHE